MPGAASWGCRSAAWGFAFWLALSPLTAAAENWTITPQIGDQETYTDNLFLTPTNRRSDLVTTLSPSLSITGASARLQGSFNYSPTAYLYALNPGLNAVGQNLYANGTATLIPNHLFVDAHAYGSLTPTTPGLATGGLAAVPSFPGASFGAIGTGLSTAIPTNQLSQTFGFDASPYVVGHFGGFGTGELRYTISDTNFGAPTTSALTPPGFAVLSNTSTLTNEGTAAFLTGEDFGRFASRIVLDAAQQTGTGSGTISASQTIAVDDSAYALTPRIFPLASLGYENIHYSSVPPVRFVDTVWGVGLRLTPRPNANLTALYGHRYGVTAPYLSLSYGVTPRTRVAVTYSEALTTTAEEIADNLAVSAASPALHLIVDTRTLLPLAVVNPALGLQSGVFRTSQLNGTVTLDRERNHFLLSAYRMNSAVVARNVAGLGVSQQTIGGSAQWTHNITPRTNAVLGIGDAQFNYPTEPQFAENLITAGVTLTHSLTRTVNGWAGYSFFRSTSPQPELHLLSNVVFVGISKVF